MTKLHDATVISATISLEPVAPPSREEGLFVSIRKAVQAAGGWDIAPTDWECWRELVGGLPENLDNFIRELGDHFRTNKAARMTQGIIDAVKAIGTPVALEHAQRFQESYDFLPSLKAARQAERDHRDEVKRLRTEDRLTARQERIAQRQTERQDRDEAFAARQERQERKERFLAFKSELQDRLLRLERALEDLGDYKNRLPEIQQALVDAATALEKGQLREAKRLMQNPASTLFSGSGKQRAPRTGSGNRSSASKRHRRGGMMVVQPKPKGAAKQEQGGKKKKDKGDKKNKKAA